MSMKPGATTCPWASMLRSARGDPRLPTAAIRPSRTATSAAYHGVPVPSMTCPLRITRSYSESAAWPSGTARTSSPSARENKPPSRFISARYSPLQHLDLEKSELELVGVDHVVRHAFFAGVRQTAGKLRITLSVALFEAQHAAGQRYDDIIVRMHVMPGLGSGGKAPLRHSHPFILDLYVRGSSHVGIALVHVHG